MCACLRCCCCSFVWPTFAVPPFLRRCDSHRFHTHTLSHSAEAPKETFADNDLHRDRGRTRACRAAKHSSPAALFILSARRLVLIICARLLLHQHGSNFRELQKQNDCTKTDTRKTSARLLLIFRRLQSFSHSRVSLLHTCTPACLCGLCAGALSRFCRSLPSTVHRRPFSNSRSSSGRQAAQEKKRRYTTAHAPFSTPTSGCVCVCVSPSLYFLFLHSQSSLFLLVVVLAPLLVSPPLTFPHLPSPVAVVAPLTLSPRPSIHLFLKFVRVVFFFFVCARAAAAALVDLSTRREKVFVV